MRTPLAFLAGTRPELLKLLPVAQALDPGLRPALLWSGQQAGDFRDWEHPGEWQMLPPPRHPLPRRQLERELRTSIGQALARLRPQALLVQGDTVTAAAGAVAARALDIALIHLEAGLRAASPRTPFPEEIQRRRIARLAHLHLCPSALADTRLAAEGIGAERRRWVGSTAIDALRRHAPPASLPRAHDLLVAVHRRENAGRGLVALAEAMRRLCAAGWRVSLLDHPNPQWRQHWDRLLAGEPRIRRLPALTQADWWRELRASALLLSDSGGALEELPYLGVPLLAYRRGIERPEALASGHALRLHPGCTQAILAMIDQAQAQSWPSAWPLEAHSPYGDGRAGPRAAAAISEFLESQGREEQGHARGTENRPA